MSYDPYYDFEEDVQPTDEWMYQLYGSPQFDSGVNPLPGKTLAQDRSYMNDLMKQTGLSIPMLAGTMNEGAGDDGGVSALKQLYGSNPQYARIFEALESGNDPDTAVKGVIDEFGIDEFDDTTIDRLYDVADKYGQGRMGSGADRSRQFTMANGKKFEGDPDINGFATEHQLMGAPSDGKYTGELMKRYAQSQGRDLGRGKRGSALPTAWRKPTGRPNAAGGVSKEVQDAIAAVAKWRMQESRQTNVRSDANKDMMRNILTYRSVYGI